MDTARYAIAPAIPPPTPEVARGLAAALRHAAMQRSAEAVAHVACEHLGQWLPAAVVECVFYDQETATLWRESEAADFSVARGLVAIVAVTGAPLYVPDVLADPRALPALDAPGDLGARCFAAAPVVDRRGAVHAVLVVRRPSDLGLSRAELTTLVEFAGRIGIIVEALHLEGLADAETDPGIVAAADHFYDPEALAAHRQGRLFGTPVDFGVITPRWLYVAVAVAMVATLVATVFVQINRYASAPAVVVTSDAIDVTSGIDAIVERNAVVVGQQVRAGDPIAYLVADRQRNDLASAKRELEHRLAARLAAPTDRQLEDAVARAAVAAEHAEARLSERTIVAPRDGRVGDVALSPGQEVAAGQTVATLIAQNGELQLTVAVDAQHRPTLHTGQPIRLELDGYPFVYQQLEVSAVSDRALGPAEARAVLGRSLGDTIAVDGPVVLVEGALTQTTFGFEGRSYSLHAGMRGRADIRVARERLLFTLLPFLKRIAGP